MHLYVELALLVVIVILIGHALVLHEQIRAMRLELDGRRYLQRHLQFTDQLRIWREH